MIPRNLMWIGFALSILSAVGILTFDEDGSLVVLLFAGGALFGKGYGVWEERSDGGAGE